MHYLTWTYLFRRLVRKMLSYMGKLEEYVFDTATSRKLLFFSNCVSSSVPIESCMT